MKFSFLLLLALPHLGQQQTIRRLQHILLRFDFPPSYDAYSKWCCKLNPGSCFKLLDSTGYTCDLLRGRVSKIQSSGWIEFTIYNAQYQDGGYYRCMVQGTPFYSDYYVEVTEVSVDHSQTQPPLTTTTIQPLVTSTSVRPDSSVPVLSQDYSDTGRTPWNFSLPLIIIVSLVVMTVITLVFGVVCYKLKARRERPDKCGETLRESPQQDAVDTSGLVYTTVDFRAQQKKTDVYASVRSPRTRAAAPDPADHEAVEYSTLAVHK